MAAVAAADSSRIGSILEYRSHMPRGPRIDFSGAVHHVYSRGNEKRDIFLDDRDRGAFLERAARNFPRWGNRCIAWALMPNHFHFLLQSDSGALPSFMKCLLTGYSVYFNERHGRVGHLFQNRYKSRLVSRESYLREAIRYVHLNPLRSGIVKSVQELDDYPWTGHYEIMRDNSACHLDFDMVREAFFDDDESCWKARYRGFMKSGSLLTESGDGTGREGGTGVEGDGIASAIREEADIPAGARPGTKEAPKAFAEILARVSESTGIPADVIAGPSRKYPEVRARRMVLLACRKDTGASITDICRWLGISPAAGWYLVNSGSSGASVS
jgi:putative transposase